jgi:hypothetical protein
MADAYAANEERFTFSKEIKNFFVIFLEQWLGYVKITTKLE